MSKENVILINNSSNNYFNKTKNISSAIIEILKTSLNKSIPINISSSLNHKFSSSDSLITKFKYFIETIPQSFLLMCVLILFILFFIVLIIILICLIKKRKKLLQTETIVNNNKIDINKMILQNSNNLPSNLKDFHSIQNNSNMSNYAGGTQDMSLNEIKEKNLKEEIHSIVSGTLNEITINKSRKSKRKKKGKNIKTNGQQSAKSENNNIISNKELNEENK